MFKFFKQNKQEPVSTERAKIKAMFQAMNEDPEIRAAYDVIRLPAVRDGFRAERVEIKKGQSTIVSDYNYVAPDDAYRVYIYNNYGAKILLIRGLTREFTIAASGEHPAGRLLLMRLNMIETAAKQRKTQSHLDMLNDLRTVVIKDSRGSR